MKNLLFLLIVLSFFVACSGDDSSSVETTEFSSTRIVKDSVEFTAVSNFTALYKASDLLSQVNASEGKLIFRDENSGNLIYWDLKADRFVNLNNGIDAHHPEISPDGKWVAFCTLYEGLGGASQLYVQNLENGKLLQLGVNSGVVPRWRVLETGDTAIVYVDNAGLTQKEEWKSYGTWMVRFSQEKFSVPKKLFNGAFVGVSHDFRFAVAGGADFIRRKITVSDGDTSYADTLWYGGEQVCNLSLAKDSSLRTSFLDLTGKEGLNYVGAAYKPHQRLLVVDQDGEIVQAVPSPEGFSFDHTEWISRGEFHIATLQDFSNNLLHNRIALVNMADSAVTELVGGNDMYHPTLWVK